MTARVEADLRDDFEPPTPDSDVALDVDGTGTWLLYLPRRVRSLTTVQTRDSYGTLTTQTATSYRLKGSLNAAGTAMADGAKLDWLEALEGLSTIVWPYGTSTVCLTGKYGWAAVPTDIKRLVALRVYDLAKAKADPLSNITQRTTADATIILGDSREIADIEARYRRDEVMVG